MTSGTEQMAATAACTNLILGFAYLVDQRRYDELVDLFASDGVFQRPGAKATGHEELRVFMDARSLETETRHVCAPPFFGPWEDGRGTAVTYVTMFHSHANADGSPMTIDGVAGLVEFHHVFVQTDAGWKIALHESRVIMIRETK